MPTTHTDGKIKADSFIADIAGMTYVVNRLQLSTPNVAVERNDTKGKLAAKKIELDEGRMTGTAELQIDSSAKAQQRLWGHVLIVPADATSTGEEIPVIIEDESVSVETRNTLRRTVSVRAMIQDLYLRPDGESYYFRPGGISYYRRPA